eukprot:TRINITY_DN121996_c0_g1_i1.p1 TRINITY_DN121996_c0_g1~~TRINITY_DN121996_c0_g1_i1.p1  ORF type:complete len:692 (-),score=166.09 TRINITY_DN121996_c0_g1_i1:191-2266(-)
MLRLSKQSTAALRRGWRQRFLAQAWKSYAGWEAHTATRSCASSARVVAVGDAEGESGSSTSKASLRALLAASAVVAVASAASTSSSRRDTCHCDSLLPKTLLSRGELYSRYEVMDELGSGGYATVYRARKKSTGVYYAVKKQAKLTMLSKSSRHSSEALVAEVRLTRALGHDPRFVNFVDVFEDQDNVYMVMELCHGVTLFDWIEQAETDIDEAEIRILSRDILNALVGLEEHGLLHLDIKPENFVMTHSLFPSPGADEPSVRLVDFGISEYRDKCDVLKESGEMRGTFAYMAPELLEEHEYSPQNDVYSSGVTIFALFCQELPCEVDDLTGKAEDRSHGQAAWDQRIRSMMKENGASAAATDLVARMLTLDPKKRITTAEALKHPFITHHEKEEKLEKLANARDRARIKKLGRRLEGRRMVRVTLQPGEILWNAGDRNNDLFFIEEGSGSLDHLDRDKNTIISSAAGGDVVGVTECFTGLPRAGTCRCHPGPGAKVCKLLRMPPSSVELLQQEDLLEYTHLRELADMRNATRARRDWLQKGTLFGSLGSDFLYALAQRLRPLSLQPGEVLIREGDLGESMFVIRDGTLDIYARPQKQRHSAVDTEDLGDKVASLRAGTIVGELALFPDGAAGPMGRRRAASIVVPKTGAEVIELKRADLEEMLAKFPKDKVIFDEVCEQRRAEIAARTKK